MTDKAYRSAYYLKNRAKLLAKSREYASTPERRARHRQLYHERYYRKQRPKQNEKAKQMASLIAACKDLPCADCGNRFPPMCMDFDHVRGTKVKPVSWMLSASLETVFAEIEKCEVVCANCHRIRTYERRQHRWRERNAA